MSTKKPEPGKPKYLYHYTTAEGLKGIIENQEIWASDIFSLNDASEVYHGVALLKKHLATQQETSEGRLNTSLEAFREALGEIGPHTATPTYVCSFSEEPNDLSQWRAYCPDGGYAIGM